MVEYNVYEIPEEKQTFKNKLIIFGAYVVAILFTLCAVFWAFWAFGII